MLNNGSGPLTAESQVSATSYNGQTLGEYAALGGLAIEPLLEALNAAAESGEFARRSSSISVPDDDQSGWRERTPPMGSVGYTGSYCEPSADIVDVSVVSVLEARGPE